jgi:chromosome segregation ATPase
MFGDLLCCLLICFIQIRFVLDALIYRRYVLQIGELLTYMNKLQDLQVIEKDLSTSALEDIKTENRELRMEVSGLKETLQAQERDNKELLNEKSAECGQLRAENSDFCEKIARLNESLQSLESANASLEEKQMECEQLATERDDLKESLQLFEEEETLTVKEYKANHLNLQKELDDVKFAFDTFKEDTAATLKDKQAETDKRLKEINDLQITVQTSEATKIASLEEKKLEIQKLLNAVETLHEALECGRQEVQQLNASLEEARDDLEQTRAQREVDLLRAQEKAAEWEDNISSGGGDDLQRALAEVQALKSFHADLEAIAAEKTLEVWGGVYVSGVCYYV